MCPTPNPQRRRAWEATEPRQDNTGEQTLSETAIANDKNMPAEPLSDATADNDNLGMQTDDNLAITDVNR